MRLPPAATTLSTATTAAPATGPSAARAAAASTASRSRATMATRAPSTRAESPPAPACTRHATATATASATSPAAAPTATTPTPDRYPGRLEICDVAGLDEDCDPATFGARDADGDGAIDAPAATDRRCGDDCDDAHAAARIPTRAEACDTIDNDCDGATDESVQGTFTVDVDGDGLGSRAARPSEGPRAGCRRVRVVGHRLRRRRPLRVARARRDCATRPAATRTATGP